MARVSTPWGVVAAGRAGQPARLPPPLGRQAALNSWTGPLRQFPTAGRPGWPRGRGRPRPRGTGRVLRGPQGRPDPPQRLRTRPYSCAPERAGAACDRLTDAAGAVPSPPRRPVRGILDEEQITLASGTLNHVVSMRSGPGWHWLSQGTAGSGRPFPPDAEWSASAHRTRPVHEDRLTQQTQEPP